MEGGSSATTSTSPRSSRCQRRTEPTEGAAAGEGERAVGLADGGRCEWRAARARWQGRTSQNASPPPVQLPADLEHAKGASGPSRTQIPPYPHGESNSGCHLERVES